MPDITSTPPSYAHAGRVAKIIVRGQEVWYIWEVHPSIAKKFDVQERVGFFEIEVSKLLPNAYNKTKLLIFQLSKKIISIYLLLLIKI